MAPLHVSKTQFYGKSVIFCFVFYPDDTDYVAVRKTLVFAFGFGTRQCVNIPILGDECLEEMESFYVSLSSNQSCVEFGLDEIQVYIEEDDGKAKA